MKRTATFLMCLALISGLTACGSSRNENTVPPVVETIPETEESSEGITEENEQEISTESLEADEPEQAAGSNTLVVYFSMPETTNPDNMTQEEDNSVVVIDGEVLGNTQYVAYVIQENTGADLFRIEPETAYPTDHETLVDLAADEKEQSARPAIREHVENMEQYDTVFVGYPNWWGDMPMILYTFFDEYDFSGKTIIPFNTHGGSGFSNTINTIAELEPDAEVNSNGFTVSRNNVEEAEPDILNWLAELGYTGEAEGEQVSQIAIQIGDNTLYAELNDSELAKEFAGLLPQTISMQRVGGGREFYGSLDGSLDYNEADAQTTFENGEIAYWYSGNGFCILYDNQVEEPEVESGIIILGRITSDFSMLPEMEDRIEATITLYE